jgi:glucosylglycerate phosphorylase
MDETSLQALVPHLAVMYGAEAESLAARLAERLSVFRKGYSPPPLQPLDEKDAFLITYPDQFLSPGTLPLDNLVFFCDSRLQGLVSGVHVLPFFPSSSDDGFSVLDYRLVEPSFGEWQHIRWLAGSFHLMVDGVVNHVSAQSAWFRRFLAGDPAFRGYFIVPGPNTDLSAVVRPRTSPLLTAFASPAGTRSVWTTFSPDQVDLNYGNPDVLFEILDIILFYVSQGASLIRLDAVAYLWKQPGTPCIHLPQAHAFVRLLRAVLDAFAPHVLIVTETNVPHQDNISYFGNGSDEAHLVYNFTLPPLLLHALATESAV